MLKGRRGEEEAARYLESRGYKILERNFRTRWGEIDLVARDRSTVVFVEVKTRSSTGFARPEESVTHAKQEHMRRAAGLWLSDHYPNDIPQCRFDVVSVTLIQTPLPRTSASLRSPTSGDPKSKDLHIEHFEGAFE